MKSIQNAVRNFINDEQGLTTVEYAIAGALVGAAVILAFTNLGLKVAEVIDGITAVL